MKILLIEDMAGFAKPIQEFLEARGHIVSWVIGATRIDARSLTGITATPGADPLNDQWDGNPSRLVEIDCAAFDVALVDGGLIGPVKDGTDYVRALSHAGVFCIAISGGGAGNPGLLQAGAKLGIAKELVILAIQAGLFDLDRVTQNPASAAATLARFAEEKRAEATAARQDGRQFDYGFPFLQKLD